MKPLNEMGDALLAINQILQRRKREREMSAMKSIGTEKPIKQSDALPSFNMHQTELQPAKTPTRNEENSFRTQLSHQRIEEFPNVNPEDIQQLRMVNVKTMQDLLGCYLIHDTPDEFRTFLIKIYHLSEKAASTITQFLYQWTRCHLDGITDDSKVGSG